MIEKGLGAFAEGISVLMNMLDGLADIHPAVTGILHGLLRCYLYRSFLIVAVVAFKGVYMIALARKDNDDRIKALYVQMREMMGSFAQYDSLFPRLIFVQLTSVILDRLKTLTDPNDVKRVAPEVSEIAEKTAIVIKECASACDLYSKQHLLVKVAKAALWKNRLTGFSTSFARRREELSVVLSSYSARGIAKVNEVVQSTKER